LLITGIKHVFFLIGATMTPGAILMESRTRDVELERVAVIAWRENANPRLLPSNNLVPSQKIGFGSGPGLRRAGMP
jgi:hypothetical protein